MLKQSAIDQSSTVELNAGQSTRVLEQARCAAAPATIALEDLDAAASGRIVNLTDGTIEIAIDDFGHTSPRIGTGSRCDVQFTVSDERHGFEADVSSTEHEGRQVRVILARPRGIWVRQRRRFWRTPLRGSSMIELTFSGDRASVRGAMLNVSSDGLACRVDRRDAHGLCVGDPIIARFVLDGESEPFSLEAELKGKTPAGSPARTVLRVQFIPATLSQEDHLRIRRATRVVPEPA